MRLYILLLGIKYLTHLQNTLNMFKRIGLFIFLLIGTSQFLFSQITISSPVLRQVFQRDLSNKASLTITGNYSQSVDAIQVKLTAVKVGQGTDIDWTTISSNPLGGIFKGTLPVKGGWYKLEVRGTLAGKIVGNISTIDKVGIGEVFVIAGQSNAGGSSMLEANETGAADDRVNCANFISPRSYYPDFPFQHADLNQFSIIEFSQLKKTAAIGPTGLGPYYWGKVGDALSAKLNVPIMFFNTGWAGASVRVWRESAENPTVGVPSDFQFDNTNNNRYVPGYPYSNLSAVLSYYGINLGVRAVLWMEGETQNLLNLDAIANGLTPPVTIDNYLDNLRRLVKRTRKDLGNNKLAWVVARTSYSSQLNCANQNTLPPSPSPIIVNAQNQAISDPTLAPMYPGPFTDNIQVSKRGERADCVHFTGKGLDEVANAWIKALTEDNKNFFETVEPILVDNIPTVSLECVSEGVLKLTLPEGYATYEWFNSDLGKVVGTTNTINTGSASFTARVTRSNGNIIQIPKFTVKANNPPKAPIVTASSDVNFCLGTSVKLQSTTEVVSPIYEWASTPIISNLPRTKDIDASLEGTYKLRVIDKNDCASPYSTEVKLVAKPRPEKPLISTSGSTEFCEGQTITLTSSTKDAVGYKWSNGEITQAITVKKAGTYNVQTIGTNGCESLSSTDNINIRVNSLPATPQIRALSDTVFCDGGSVNLELSRNDVDNSPKFGWSKNSGIVKGVFDPNNSNPKPTITITGTELVRGFVTNVSGCDSKLSNAIQVVKKDNPSVLTILPKSTYSLVARSDKKAEQYVWKLDGKVQSSLVDSLIRPNDNGSYTVIGKNVYKVKTLSGILTCQSAESEKFDFNPYNAKGLSIYPNPSNGRFYLESQNEFKDAIINIFTIDGKLVYEGIIETIKLPKVLDLSSLTEGTYILRVQTSIGSKVSKLIRIER